MSNNFTSSWAYPKTIVDINEGSSPYIIGGNILIPVAIAAPMIVNALTYMMDLEKFALTMPAKRLATMMIT